MQCFFVADQRERERERERGGGGWGGDHAKKANNATGRC
jgi:hypothetical protein